MEGWIKLHRKLMEKSYYRKDSEAVHLWIHILICANRTRREETLGGKKIICEPGQFTTGRKQLSECTGINESKIERLLNKFEKIEQQIEQQKTNTNRLISVRNWSEYQTTEQEVEQQSNNNRTTTEQQLNTLKEVKEYKEVKEGKKEGDIYISRDHLSITWGEMNKLIDGYGDDVASDTVTNILNYRKNVKYKSLYLTAIKWIQKDIKAKEEKIEQNKKQPKLSI